MSEQHPLTDEICEEITFWRNPYDNMRAAADWQLEQVLEWGYKYLYPDQINALKDAMRPQQQEDN